MKRQIEKNEQPITPAQLKGLQTHFSRLGWDEEERHGFVAKFTDGRTCSTRELTKREAAIMYSHLKDGGQSSKQSGYDPQYEQRRRVVAQIYYLSLKIGFLNKHFVSDDKNERLMNYAKLSKWTREKTAIRKNVGDMELQELLIVKRQMEAIARKESGHGN